MSLLSYNELVKLVEMGVIENCPLELVNGASIDVTLAPKILIESQQRYRIVDFGKREPLKMKNYDMALFYVLKPGEFILGSTQQIFNLPSDIAAEFKLKSSAARVGLNQLTACWCDPTWHGSALTLELNNVSQFHGLRLCPGDRVGQVVFYRCAPVPEAKAYRARGRYNGDREVSPIKP